MLSKELRAVLLGYSGHGIVVAEAAALSGVEILGYMSLKEEKNNPFNLDYLGNEDDDLFNWNLSQFYILGVGSNSIRERIANKVHKFGGVCLTIIHPQSFISEAVSLDAGTFVARNVVINPLVSVGKNVILNTSCSIDHECVLGDNIHLAPGAVLAGNVTVKNGAFIGANSVIAQGITIGKNAVIGAGSVVIRNVEDNQVVVGNPAKILQK